MKTKTNKTPEEFLQSLADSAQRTAKKLDMVSPKLPTASLQHGKKTVLKKEAQPHNLQK
jgi:hypothetical protein